MKIHSIVPLLASLALTPVALADPPALAAAHIGDPMPGLTPQELALFNQGKAAFEHEFTLEEGRGPLYNGKSCVTCHFNGATGGSDPTTANNVHHLTIEHDGNTFLAFELGGPVRQLHSVSGEPGSGSCTIPAETDPTAPESQVSVRHTPPVFGFGLIDAVPDAEILEYQGPKAWKRPGVLGVANWGVELENLGRLLVFTFDITRTQPGGAPRVGRFGWHGAVATLFQFSTEPFNIELGVSTPFFPRENMPDGSKISPECKVLSDKIPNDTNSQGSLSLFYFQAFNTPPPRARVNARTVVGEVLFNAVGCADCHRATLHTTKDYYAPMPDGSAHRVAALSGKEFHPYSDLLLHDLGPANADHRPQGRASPSFWRTTPLWGIHFKSQYLHDGSANTEEQAILKHGGEGQASTAAYQRLNAEEKQLITEFLESL